MSLKFSILNKRIKAQHINAKLVPYNEVKNIALVMNEPFDTAFSNLIQAFTADLRNDGKTVEHIIVYRKNKPIQEEKSGNFFTQKSVESKDVSSIGLPKSEEFKAILNECYDYLVFCNPVHNFKNICLAGLSKSKCKIGPSTFAKKHLDLLIEEKELNEVYFKSIYTTLNQIR